MMEIDDGNKVIDDVITVSRVRSCSMNTGIPLEYLHYPSFFREGLAYQLCLVSFMRCS